MDESSAEPPLYMVLCGSEIIHECDSEAQARGFAFGRYREEASDELIAVYRVDAVDAEPVLLLDSEGSREDFRRGAEAARRIIEGEGDAHLN